MTIVVAFLLGVLFGAVASVYVIRGFKPHTSLDVILHDRMLRRIQERVVREAN